MPAGVDSPDVLVVSPSAESMQPLLSALREQELRADHAVDLPSARAAFLARGGHRLLVVGPELSPGSAAEIVDTLRAVDPGLWVALFGAEQLRGRGPERLHRLGGHHPGSRAGVGALLKLVRRLG